MNAHPDDTRKPSPRALQFAIRVSQLPEEHQKRMERVISLLQSGDEYVERLFSQFEAKEITGKQIYQLLDEYRPS